MTTLREKISQTTQEYATFDKTYGQYNISINDIDDFVLEEIAALITKEDSVYAAEATGLDNPCYLTHMLPALQDAMEDVTNKEAQLLFRLEWKKGVTKYFKPLIEQYLIEAVVDLNTETNSTNGSYYRNHAYV